MARKSTLQPLLLTDPPNLRNEQDVDGAQNPRMTASFSTPSTPKSPRLPFKFSSSKNKPATPLSQEDELPMQVADPAAPTRSKTDLPQSQTLPALSQYPADQSGGERQQIQQERDRPARSGFFSNYKASKSSSRLQQSDTVRAVTDENMSRGTDRPAVAASVSRHDPPRMDPTPDRPFTRSPNNNPSRSDVSLVSVDSIPPPTSTSTSTTTTTKKSKPKPFSLLGRQKSIRDEQSPRQRSPDNRHLEPGSYHAPLKTAPLREGDRSFREMMNSNVRQHSADRQTSSARDISGGRDTRDNSKSQLSSSLRENSGHGFLNNLKNAGAKGGAFGKGLFGKSSRSGSTNHKELPVDDEHYELKVINKPLVEQTRITRISKNLEDSRDKTEFWMPAFPWRAIDYLNYKGSDVEGLYRVPGSGPQIKKWQRRFDEELDIDLFEQDDLYDINIIGSMLKAWLRELPDELFPKSSQDKVAREAQGSESVPQALIDELSNLPPFNYYLLFAITCHLSLLLNHQEKNKMDFRNLCICFQPCMRIDAFCFKFLVCDWRECWKGCKNEAKYTAAEYAHLSQLGRPPNSAEGRSSTAVESHDERNVSSSDSSKPPSRSQNEQAKWAQHQQHQQHQQQQQQAQQVQGQGPSQPQQRQGSNQNSQKQRKPLPPSTSQTTMSSISSTTTTVPQDRTPPRGNDMRPLSPIKPLSPIGL